MNTREKLKLVSSEFGLLILLLLIKFLLTTAQDNQTKKRREREWGKLLKLTFFISAKVFPLLSFTFFCVSKNVSWKSLKIFLWDEKNARYVGDNSIEEKTHSKSNPCLNLFSLWNSLKQWDESEKFFFSDSNADAFATLLEIWKPRVVYTPLTFKFSILTHISHYLHIFHSFTLHELNSRPIFKLYKSYKMKEEMIENEKK